MTREDAALYIRPRRCGFLVFLNGFQPLPHGLLDLGSHGDFGLFFFRNFHGHIVAPPLANRNGSPYSPRPCHSAMQPEKSQSTATPWRSLRNALLQNWRRALSHG